jgi:hypothetical protein
MMDNTRNQPVIRYGLGILGVAVLLAVSQAVWAQAGPVTDDNIVERITTMKTPADHQAIATYYQTKVAAEAADVKRHEAMVKVYGGNGMKTMNRHCDLLLQTARQRQAEYESLAKEHADMAAAAAK